MTTTAAAWHTVAKRALALVNVQVSLLCYGECLHSSACHINDRCASDFDCGGYAGSCGYFDFGTFKTCGKSSSCQCLSCPGGRVLVEYLGIRIGAENNHCRNENSPCSVKDAATVCGHAAYCILKAAPTTISLTTPNNMCTVTDNTQCHCKCTTL